jgi:methylated-DNA-[protein]-cysteine S-methyltransferase
MLFSHMIVPSPLGAIDLIARGDELAAVYLPDGPGIEAVDDIRTGEVPVLALAAGQLAEYFAGDRRVFDLPLARVGTPFQQRVWRELVAIPFGETRSYGEIARTIGRPTASRAVGAANGKNPFAIVVPCHRVIGAGGALTGYAGGMAAKRWLLAHEGHATNPELDGNSRSTSQLDLL